MASFLSRTPASQWRLIRTRRSALYRVDSSVTNVTIRKYSQKKLVKRQSLKIFGKKTTLFTCFITFASIRIDNAEQIVVRFKVYFTFEKIYIEKKNKIILKTFIHPMYTKLKENIQYDLNSDLKIFKKIRILNACRVISVWHTTNSVLHVRTEFCLMSYHTYLIFLIVCDFTNFSLEIFQFSTSLFSKKNS